MTTPASAPCPHCPDSSRLFSTPHGLKVHIGRKHKNAALAGGVKVVPELTTPTTSGGPIQPSGLTLDDLPALKAKIRVLRHVPKGARCLAAGRLSSLIEKCIQSNNTDDWLTLLSFAFTALRVPVQGDKKSLTSKVKSNIEGAQLHLPVEHSSIRPHSIYKSVQAKVFEGDLRGAARLLTSDCSFAPVSDDTLSTLRAKHPTSSRPLEIPPLPDSSTPCLVVKAEDVSTALHSFYRGSAAGMDGLRPEHLKELCSPAAGDNGIRLLESITRLCNFLLEGNLNPTICPFMYGGTLCALKKKDGGIRPIAVGNTFRRLVSKLCCQAVKHEISRYLQPHQLGFGTPLGCEAAIHAARAFVMREGSNDVLVKLDIRNAFNSIERGSLLSEVRELTPSIFPYLCQCYAAPSNLSYDGVCILSQEGAQQGDPLGPLIFSMAIHKAITTLKSPLNVWYLDDGTLGGSPETVEEDVKSLFPALKELGLEVNTSKCEFYSCSSAAAQSNALFASLIPGLRIMDREGLSLLGAPIFSEGVPVSLRVKTQTLTSLGEHFQHLPAHVSLTLLRACFGLPKLTYVIRTTPSWEFPEDVLSFDSTLKRITEEILNIGLDELSPMAFLASSHGVAGLVSRILPETVIPIRVPYADEAFGAWQQLCPNTDLPARPGLQRSWDEVLGNYTFAQLCDGASGAVSARLKAVSRRESGAWLHALPSPHLGTLLDNDSLRVAAGLRLGCSVCEPHVCICGAMVEADGYHGLSCARCAGRRPRHHAINELIRRALVSAEIPCALEPPGLSRADGKRPDGLTLIPWRRGRCLIWDATCISTFAPCHLPATQRAGGAGAETAAKNKHLKYSALESAYEFVPFAVETAGPWGEEAIKFVSDLGRRLRERGRDPRSGDYLAQNISLAIQRGNAASLMGTFGRRDAERGIVHAQTMEEETKQLNAENFVVTLADLKKRREILLQKKRMVSELKEKENQVPYSSEHDVLKNKINTAAADDPTKSTIFLASCQTTTLNIENLVQSVNCFDKTSNDQILSENVALTTASNDFKDILSGDLINLSDITNVIPIEITNQAIIDDQELILDPESNCQSPVTPILPTEENLPTEPTEDNGQLPQRVIESHYDNIIIDTTISEHTSFPEQELEPECSRESRKRQRTTKSNNTKRIRNKKLRMTGKEYIGFSKTVVGEKQIYRQESVKPARALGKTCDSTTCLKSQVINCEKFTESVRQPIFETFWNLTWLEKKMFVCSMVDVKQIVRKTNKGQKSRRTNTKTYYLKLNDQKERVCMKTFIRTLGIKEWTVRYWLGENTKAVGITSEQTTLDSATRSTVKESIRTFLRSLPKLPSHYCRKNSMKLYLEPLIQSKRELYRIYVKDARTKSEKAGCRKLFEDVLKDENIALFKPKKDACDLCCSYKVGNISEEEYKQHILRKDLARQEKDKDKIAAKNGTINVITADLQAVKLCPYLTASALYFKTKLMVHNFTIYNLGNDDVMCYWFDETTADLKATTYANFYIDYLTKITEDDSKDIIIFTDGCTSQNRNAVVSNALLRLAMRKNITITQKFLEKGHTQMEVDSVHSVIERKLKNREIHLPSQYGSITKEARLKPSPYKVVMPDYAFFKDFGIKSNLIYKSIRPGRGTGAKCVVDIRVIKYNPNGLIEYKLNYGDDFKLMPQRTKKNINESENLPQLFQAPLPIAKSKYDHLQQLKEVIPKDCHEFYDKLPFKT